MDVELWTCPSVCRRLRERADHTLVDQGRRQGAHSVRNRTEVTFRLVKRLERTTRDMDVELWTCPSGPQPWGPIDLNFPICPPPPPPPSPPPQPPEPIVRTLNPANLAAVMPLYL